MWAKDGNVPEIHWIINSGNTRRESTQALMIPELKKAGFNVIADNCDAACYFQQRLPALEVRHGHVHQHGAARTRRSPAIMSCDSVPSEANGNQGQNSRRLVQRGRLGAHDRVRPDSRRDASVPT